MRSFAGILHTDGSPPDARVLRRMGELLRLPTSSAPILQIDDRCGIVTVAHRPGVTGDAQDISKLEGEFSFAVWNDSKQELFCARDRFGVRPLYYARIGRGLVFSDSIDAVLAHPDVSVELDTGAVADYLTTGLCGDEEATIYAQIRRLPPAHTLTAGHDSFVRRRYWTLPEPRPHKDGRARFEAALAQAVADRLTQSSAVVFMSGGLDSTAMAALARERKPETALTAFTSVYRTRIADVEEPFAVEAARSIGIPIELFPLDAYDPLDSLGKNLWTAEPGPLLTASMTRDVYAAAAKYAPVALHGHPADAVLASDPQAIVRELLRERRFLRLGSALFRYTAARRRLPYFFLRELLGRPRSHPPSPAPPDWLRVPVPRRERPSHPLRSAMWSSFFEWAHPLLTRAPIEVSYPWCDVRVVEAALSLEPIPWLVDKHVLRTMLRGRVSETIRRRRKTFLQGDPWTAPLPRTIDVEAAERYIDPERFRRACFDANGLSDTTLRGFAFARWLRDLPAALAQLRSGEPILTEGHVRDSKNHG